MRIVPLYFLVFSYFFLCGKSVAADLTCPELKSAINMVRSSNKFDLQQNRVAAGNSYRADVVYYFRFFEINKNAYTARQLFNIIPADEKQYAVWMTMGDSLCDDENVSDMDLLDKFGSRLPLRLSQAVLIQPSEMPKYVNFALLAAQDPHSNLVVNMRKVCTSRHDIFKNAVRNLVSDKKIWFTNHIMDINSCKPLISPESD